MTWVRPTAETGSRSRSPTGRACTGRDVALRRGRPSAAPDLTGDQPIGTGRGIIGMRERAAVYGARSLPGPRARVGRSSPDFGSTATAGRRLDADAARRRSGAPL
ncbi:hypothetical protein NKG05_20055 [Oerskovia sp. M15]